MILLAPEAPAPLAATYAQAARRWRALGADQSRWTDPQGQRELAAAFLRYHAAKLAMEEVAGVR